ncbi:TPA: hypothetical protein QCX08_004006 [Bacillus cytotoxicus]|nr:hypothetical protein [Bacillus cytotoxicus]HDR7866128.1 hypothetical protein [Bacillus cytotoxicus]HDR7881814.1 hypothetical protein [Bacillus cytotoxicus]
MEGKFAGIGLKNILAIFFLFIVFIVVAKVIVTKYPVKGLSEVIQTV